MIRPSDEMRVHLCRDVVDFRKQIRCLSVLVEDELELDPFSSHLFEFCNCRSNHVKRLPWERNGYGELPDVVVLSHGFDVHRLLFDRRVAEGPAKVASVGCRSQ